MHAISAKINVYEDIDEWISSETVPTLQYENHEVVLLKKTDIKYDRNFLSGIKFPSKFKKIGAANGVTNPVYMVGNGNLKKVNNHPLSFIKSELYKNKISHEFSRVELGLRELLVRLFPTYRRRKIINCTFRFYPARREGLHFDTFNNGDPFDDFQKKFFRFKFFYNLDTEDRIWRVGPVISEYLKSPNVRLPDALPSDLNTLCMLVDRVGALETLEATEVRIPPGGIVFANGATIAHEVTYGNRMAALEGLVPLEDRSADTPGEYQMTRRWIEDAGYGVADDREIYEAYHAMPGVHARTASLR